MQRAGGAGGGGLHPGEDPGERAPVPGPGTGQPDGRPAVPAGQGRAGEREELCAVLRPLQQLRPEGNDRARALSPPSDLELQLESSFFFGSGLRPLPALVKALGLSPDARLPAGIQQAKQSGKAVCISKCLERV